MNRRTILALTVACFLTGCGPKEQAKSPKELEEMQAKDQKEADDAERKLERKAAKKK